MNLQIAPQFTQLIHITHIHTLIATSVLLIVNKTETLFQWIDLFRTNTRYEFVEINLYMDKLYTFLLIVCFARFSNLSVNILSVCVWGGEIKVNRFRQVLFRFSWSKMWHKPISIESLFRYIETKRNNNNNNTTNNKQQQILFCWSWIKSYVCAFVIIVFSVLCFVLFCFGSLFIFYVCTVMIVFYYAIHL